MCKCRKYRIVVQKDLVVKNTILLAIRKVQSNVIMYIVHITEAMAHGGSKMAFREQ